MGGNALARGTGILKGACFLAGALALTAQTILLREFFVVASGNEFSFGPVLATWLLGVFIGSLAGGPLAARAKHPGAALGISLLGLVIAGWTGVSLIRSLHSLTGTPAGVVIQFFPSLLASILTIAPCGFFVGLSLPLAARSAQQRQARAGGLIAGLSDVYIMEALGAAAAGTLYTFILAGRVGSFTILALFSLPLLATATLLSVTEHRWRAAVTAATALFMAVLLFSGSAGRWETITAQRRWRASSTWPLIDAVDSPFQNLTLGKGDGQYSLYANGQLAVTFPDEETQRLLAARLLTQHLAPRRILVLGEALSGLGRVLLDCPDLDITAVELDPLLLQAIRDHLPPAERAALAHPRFHQLSADPRRFVQRRLRTTGTEAAAGFFDLIYVGVPEPSTALLNRCYTQDFFRTLGHMLGPSGTLALRVTSSENYTRGLVDDYTAVIFRTLKAVFPRLVVAPGMENFFFASFSPASVSDDPTVLARRFQRLGLKPAKLHLIFTSLFPNEKTAFIRQRLEEKVRGPLNTDSRPLATFAYNKILGWYSGGPVQPAQKFEKLSWPLLLFPLAAGLLLFALARRFNWPSPRRRKRLSVLAAVAAAGFAGLACELVIIYAFEIIAGYIYRAIGLIVAAFMVGIPLGARMAQRRWIADGDQAPRTRPLLRRLAGMLLLIAAVAAPFAPVIAALASYSAAAQVFIFAVIIFLGALIGGIFPLGAAIYLAESEKSRQAVGTAGMVYAADHLGAAAGALLIGPALIPLFGIHACGLFVALIALTAAAIAACSFGPAE